MAFRQLTATVNAQQVTALNRKRSSLTVKNLGAARVFLSYDSVNIAALGFPLDTGEAISLISVDGDDAELAIYCLTAAGTGDLRIQESFPI
jgi:hypothetical protein